MLRKRPRRLAAVLVEPRTAGGHDVRVLTTTGSNRCSRVDQVLVAVTVMVSQAKIVTKLVCRRARQRRRHFVDLLCTWLIRFDERIELGGKDSSEIASLFVSIINMIGDAKTPARVAKPQPRKCSAGRSLGKADIEAIKGSLQIAEIPLLMESCSVVVNGLTPAPEVS